MEQVRKFHSQSTSRNMDSFWYFVFIMAAVIVALIDIALGVATIAFCYYPVADFLYIKNSLDHMNLKNDAFWWGIASIPIFSALGIFSGLKQLKCICTRTAESPQFWKFSIFLFTEALGFLLPYYFISEYQKKVEFILGLGDHGQYGVFCLLILHPITIALGSYQVVSFFVVYKHNSLNQKKNKRRKRGNHKVCDDEDNGVQHDGAGNASIYPAMDLVTMMSELQNLPVYSAAKSSTISQVTQQCTCEDSDEDTNFTAIVSCRVGFQNDPSKALTKQSSQDNGCKFMGKRQKMLVSARKGQLYEDPEFPANHKSLGTGHMVVWKRPFEIASEAQFFTDGVSRFDVRQGSLGDCWFLAGLANLTLNPSLFSRVVPIHNEWAGDDKTYTGMCHFNFFKDGKWHEVIIDDRLPTRAGELIYMHSSDPNEFWSALIEKAYAKFNGSYSKIIGNDGIGRAMINLTGGTVERYKVQEFQNNLQKLFDLMATGLKTGKMIGCCCRRAGNNSGIYGGHAYSVTSVAKIQFKTGKHDACVRIRNPWGNEKEWSGKFSDGHPIWETVDPKVKKQLQIKFNDDGEFWFPMQELVTHFHLIEICEC